MKRPLMRSVRDATRHAGITVCVLVMIGAVWIWRRTYRVADGLRFLTASDVLYSVRTNPGGISIGRHTRYRELVADEQWWEPAASRGWSMWSFPWHATFTRSIDPATIPGYVSTTQAAAANGFVIHHKAIEHVHIAPSPHNHFGFGSNRGDWSKAPGGATTHYASLTVPLWFLILLASLLPAMNLRRMLVRRNRLRRGRCLHCGYNLFGNSSRICPECGAPVLTKRAKPFVTPPDLRTILLP